MNYGPIYIKPYSENTILIEWKPQINTNLLRHILSVKEMLQQHYPKETTEIITTYHSLLLNFKIADRNLKDEIKHLKKYLAEPFTSSASTSFIYHLPVCYDNEFCLDMQLLQTTNHLSREQIIQLHTQPDYLLYFIGFLPGFLYLGGLDPKLHFPRKETPRKKIVQGAVGIGGAQTGIYPQDSPGGWQIIGNCPIPLFEPDKNPPVIFQAGDHIRFFQISGEKYQDISNQISKKEYKLKKEPYANKSD